MRIIFAGTPDFAAVHLKCLLDNGITPVCVYTQPDRPAGRGHKLTSSAVKALALEHNLTVRTPLNFKNAEDIQDFAELQADLCIVVAYGLILPSEIVHAPRLGCINVHGSLLPKYRGAAPIQRALLDGNQETGVSIMQLTEKLDAGAVFRTAALPITAADTSGSLFDKLAALGAKTLLEVLPQILDGSLKAIPQDETQVSYASKLDKSEACLDFSKSARELDLLVRGMQPWPVAYTSLQSVKYKIFKVSCLEDGEHAAYGVISEVSRAGIRIACAQGSLLIETLQAPGKGPVKAGDYARSLPKLFCVGTHLDSF
ncbi:MAG: methionyl-tRNA formyltransferase [Succinivibrio sp.]|nr:methionyl-tRNA formyltransferase [Succinivibrio sp.]